MAEEFFSPKQVAQAIGVSESSLKRWCDKGLIEVHRTAGGHRRLLLSQVMEFVRERGFNLENPQLLGLPTGLGQGETSLEKVREPFYQALKQGDELQCRRIVLDLFLAKTSVSTMCDDLIAPSMHTVGAHWECGSIEVYQERRGCEIIEHCLYELRGLLPAPPPNAPRATGGTPTSDPYRLPTLMVEMTLRERGWQAENLGTNLPADSLSQAIQDLKPRVFWLSVSTFDSETAFLESYQQIYQQAVKSNVAVVVGGAALTEAVRHKMQYSCFCDTLQHLVSFIETIYPPRQGQSYSQALYHNEDGQSKLDPSEN